jgi:hypothetical protein
MPIRLPGTSPSQTEIKSTVDANGEHIPHVNIDSALTVDMTAVIAELQVLNSLVPTLYDYIGPLTYDVNSNLIGVVFKLGGALGAVVSTLTLAYDGSNRLISVTKT